MRWNFTGLLRFWSSLNPFYIHVQSLSYIYIVSVRLTLNLPKPTEIKERQNPQ